MHKRVPVVVVLGVLYLAAHAAGAQQVAALSGNSFQPAKPEFEEFRPVVNWVLRYAPKEWEQLKFTYAYYKQIGQIHVYSKNAASDTWAPFSTSGFEMHDFFDAYRARTHPTMAKPWTAIIVLVSKTSATFSASLCYAIPRPSVLAFDTDKMGC